MANTVDIEKMKEQYEANKNAYINQQCKCPSCGTGFTKKKAAQAFCTSQGKTQCKDFYWNNVTPDKRNNTGRIKGLADVTTNNNDVSTHSMNC